ncbi:RDD family protein [Tropicimonas marinistellae]|uniref:RDD family protein n=1 Tax=Tropicimonas marinistellae TaxID=1739787 RepID=UPI00099007E7|nr:RDD family protein [Tropicimonas marinistellae]
MMTMTDASWGLPDPDLHADLYADVPVKRAIAWMVDFVVILLLTLPILLFTAFTALFVYGFVWLFVSFWYRSLTIAGRSSTLGMRLMSIELRNSQDERLTFGEAVIHTTLHMICFSFFFPQLVSAILMMTSARGQGIPDLVLGSTALNRSR